MLITEWPTLRRWLEDSQAMRGFLHELRQAAKQWVSRGKPTDLVWRGATAQEALGHAKRHVLDLSANERDFLAAVKTQLGRSRRRKVGAVTAIAIALGLVLAGGSFALVKIKLAEKEAQEKAKQAESDRAKAEKATGELQGKLDIIEAEKRQRVTAEQNQQKAEQDKARAEQEKLAAEKEKQQLETMSREQLEEKNQELLRQVSEAKAAKEKAEDATQAARAAKAEVDKMLAKQKAENERLRAESSKIFNGSLSSGGGK
jgi:hypothetical protein